MMAQGYSNRYSKASTREKKEGSNLTGITNFWPPRVNRTFQETPYTINTRKYMEIVMTFPH
jgi:hypothetical protein